ncbi:hypothetical protein [Bradyrhizobium sp. BR 10261]|uniref:hypothetical protein n=1 Tax=Bradyrhizobium sp. BR 10261 TaxID=2749992 RepID=UPI001C64536C|nr:hypothetical protein [Bradyrhizobium sp. BR 10261]MBW7961887.1 hypothetical protein [Bradyrhizobium sp. BR 10261]
MIVRGLAGESLLVYGDGGNICDCLDVAEHAGRADLDTLSTAGSAIPTTSARAASGVVERTCGLLNELPPEALRTAIPSAFVSDG